MKLLNSFYLARQKIVFFKQSSSCAVILLPFLSRRHPDMQVDIPCQHAALQVLISPIMTYTSYPGLELKLIMYITPTTNSTTLSASLVHIFPQVSWRHIIALRKPELRQALTKGRRLSNGCWNVYCHICMPLVVGYRSWKPDVMLQSDIVREHNGKITWLTVSSAASNGKAAPFRRIFGAPMTSSPANRAIQLLRGIIEE